jgi:two-component system response regulator HydG
MIDALLDAARPWIDHDCRAATAIETLHQLQTQPYDVLVTGRELSGLPLEQFLEEALRGRPALPVVMVAEPPDYSEAVRLARLGVSEYIPWEPAEPGSIAGALARLRRAIEAAGERAPQVCDDDGVPELVGRSEAIRSVARLIRLIAPRRATVLITGRTGSGKELVARAIHAGSPRAGRPLVMVNCGAIPENLIEAEFFGHVKGAFTGAVGDKRGKFQTAEGGTILLDEIGDLRNELQAKLLRVVQTGEVDRVGGLRPDKVDVRIVAATNRDVYAMVDRGAFRSDLFYRLNVMTVVLPPLRERPDDLDVLAEYFLDRYALDSGKPMKGITVKAMASLKAHPWRGNIRELEHTIARAVALAAGDRVTESDLELTDHHAAAPWSSEDDFVPVMADESLSDGEFIALLRRNRFEIGKTAEQLRVSRGTVGLRLKGICLGLLAESGGDREKAAAVLSGGEGSADVVRSRIDEYYSNLVDVLHRFETAEQALDGCRRRWKNLPQKYFKGLDILIHRYFEQPAAKP